MKPLILVVDDNDDLRALETSMLEDGGYPTLEAPNAHEALLLLESNPSIALLLTDLAMPQINGFVLADMAVTRWPHLRVLYTSGLRDVRDAGEQPGVYYGELLAKPYRLEDLTAAVVHALGDRSCRNTIGRGTLPRRPPLEPVMH